MSVAEGLVIKKGAAEVALNQYLVVVLHGERYFISLLLINRLINPLPVFPLPDSPDFIMGVANHSGEILPIVDLCRILKIPQTVEADGRKIIICKYHDIKVGFMVERVLDVWEIDEEKIKTDTAKVLENDYFKGEYIHERDVIAVIDMARLIAEHKVG